VPKKLNDIQISRFRRDGFLSPIDILTPDQSKHYRARFETYERQQGGWYPASKGQKLYLLQTWVAELASDERVLDAVEDILGQDIFVWGTSLFVKEAGHASYVSWHQDSTYWGLSSPDVVTAWIALSPATEQSGCMKMIPGSHNWEQLEHRDTLAAENLLTRGQEIAVDVNENQAVLIELEAGQMSLHNIRTAHASDRNRSTDRRIGVAVRYIAPHVKQLNAEGDSAWLVRGADRYGHFIHESPPIADMDAAALKEHDRIMKLRQNVLFKGLSDGSKIADI